MAQAQIMARLPRSIRYRWRELTLLFIPSLILLLAMSQLLLTKLDPTTSVNLRNLPIYQGLIPILGLIGTFLVVHIILNIWFRQADQMLVPLIGLISGLGILMATRLGPDLAYDDGAQPSLGSKQLVWVIMGYCIMLGTMFVLRNIHWLARYKYTIAIIGIGLFCTTMGINIVRGGTDGPLRDSISIPGLFNLQPSELFKICIVIFFAGYLSENRDILAEGGIRFGFLRLPPLRQLGPLILMILFGLLLFLFVRELGLALLTYGTFLCMMYLGTGKMSYVWPSLIAAVVFGFIGYSLLGYVQQRFAVVTMNVLNWTDEVEAFYQAPGGGFQIVQGLINLASGGLIGTGFGLGYAATTTPVITTDLALTAFGEEFGLVGLFGIIGLYMLLLYRGYRIAIEASDPFTKLLAAGLISIIAIQTLVISAGNLKLLPLTGIPLPFLSYGGSSFIGNSIMMGILLRISYNTGREKEGLV